MLLVSQLLKHSRLYICMALALTLCGIMILPIRRTAADAPRALNPVASPDASTGDNPEDLDEAGKMFSNSAIRFEINQGQTDSRVKFLARGGSSRFFFTPEEVVFALHRTGNRSKSDRRKLANRGSKTQVIRMRLNGARKDAEILGELETQANSNYFIGNDREKWVTDVPTFAQVRYRGVYPGIDIVYHGNQKQLQYDFELAPGANPDPLAISFSGVKKIKIAADGSLQLLTAAGEFQQKAPFAFQDIHGQRVPVECKYVLRGGEVRFQLGPYDRTQKLIIDPTLVFSTYLGGNGEDRAFDIAIDGSKSVYVTGETVSTDFPVGLFPIDGYSGGMCLSNTYPCFDAFVTKFTPGGGSVLYSTYFGGAKDDIGRGITVDALRRAYIVGETGSVDFPIPISPGGLGVYKAIKKGPTDGFMVQLSTLGNEIVYGTFINGFGAGTLSASAEAVAVDIMGQVWIAGSTVSIDFPTGNQFGFPLRSSYCKFGGDNGFLIKIKPDPICTDPNNPPCPVAATQPTDPTDFIYGSYICGTGGGSEVLDMALDSFGNVWLTGVTRSNFPVTLDAFQPAFSNPSDPNQRDAFVLKTDMFGMLLLYGSYMGGTGTDIGQSIATDSEGNAYVTGTTGSSAFPITPGVADSNYGGLGEGFVVKFLSSGMAAYSTFVGGANNLDSAMGIAVDDAGNAYVTGNTGSTNFPTTPNATQLTNGGGGHGDSYLAKLSPDGSTFQFSTYLGGSGSDFGNAVCVDKAGNAYIAGHTSSTNFPTVNAFDSSFGGGQLAWDGFVTKISTEMFVISGRVTDSGNIGFRGVTVTLSGSRSATTTTDVSGNYSFEVPPNGNYTVTPSLTSFTFSPTNIPYSNLNEDKGAYFSTASAQPTPSVFPVPNLGDALVQDNGAASTMNYGSAPELLDQVKVTTGMNRESYLKFDVSNFQSATSVKLKLFGRLSSSQDTNLPASVYSVATTSWDEKTITWNGKPASGGTALDTETIIDTTARWYEWDVTSYVNAQRTAGNTVVSFVMKNDNSSIAVTRFNSREAGENMPRLELTVPTPGALPSPWTESEIPSTLTAGSTEHTSDIFTVAGAGAGITFNSTTDEFHFVNQQISGDFRFVARVLGVNNFGVNTRAGLQIRESLAANAAHATILNTPDQFLSEFMSRSASGGPNNAQPAFPGEWLMLLRIGTELRAYTSDDGANWIAAGSVVVSGLANPVYVGMVLSSGNGTDLARARYSNVAITTGTPNPPPQVGITFPASGATFNATTTVTLSASATDAGAGSITSVEFLSSATVLGTGSLSSGVYSFNWTNVQPGIYTIYARATDNGSAITTSGPVTISVNPSGAVTLSPADDAYVTDGSAATNFGSVAILSVQATAPNSFESFLKFDTTSVSNVTHATLRLYTPDGAPTSQQLVSVSAVSDITWTEGALTWNNKPTVGSVVRQSAIGGGQGFFTWDITSHVLAQKAGGQHVISLALRGTIGQPGMNFRSDETVTGARPELLLTTTTYKGRAYAEPYPDDSGPVYALLANYLRPPVNLPWLDFLSSTTTESFNFSFQQGQQSLAPAQTEDAYVPDELLIQYEDGASENTKSQARSRVRAVTKEKLKSRTRRATEHGAEAGELELVKLPGGQSVADAARVLRRQQGVKFAEPNYIYKASSTPNDPDYVNNLLWNMYGPSSTPANQFGSNAAEAWDAGHTGATTVYVGVIDTGVQVQHADLRQNAWTNSLDPVDGFDNDRSGFIDDTFGWDFANGDSSVFDGTAAAGLDTHGTHVAGSIAAVGGNGTGVVGVSWRTTFIPAKALGPFGGTTANLIKAIDYITDLKIRHGINVIATNNSWGGNPYFSQALLDAIVRGAKANILFIAAAGNGGTDQISDDNDLVPGYPSSYDTKDLAGYDAVIAVAAIASNGSLAAFSNYGPTSVDLGAPGDLIRSTLPTGTYGDSSGTSMATPHVTGAAALYSSMYRTASPLAIKQALLLSASSTPTTSLEGITVTGGRLNVGNFGR
jgi:thermitase